MPSRYLEKLYAENAFYHVFNRGVEKRNIFINSNDYDFFISLLERYLGGASSADKYYYNYPSYSSRLELIAYCLMPNHFHMLIYQKDIDAMTAFMRSLCTAYSMYFNKKYDRVGNLFQDRYKAVQIDDDSYFTHISRYIHLNPRDINKDYKKYQYSSLAAWLNPTMTPNWLKPDKVKAEFSTPEEYSKFLEEYKKIDKKLYEIH